MKKFFALCVLFSLPASVAMAAVSVSTTPAMEPAISTLLAFNKWLYGNDYYGTVYINNNLTQAVALAQQWDNHATLSSVDVTFQEPDQVSCSFVFGSLQKPNEVYNADCVDLTTAKVQGQTSAATHATTPQNLFGAPTMKLRKFVSDILGSTMTMNQIRSYMNGTSESNVEFTLSNVNGQLTWVWGMSDGHQRGADVDADATQLNSPLVFQGLGN